MDTLVLEKNGRLIFTNQARVVHAREEVGADLAAATNNFELDQANPYLKWIVGDFVEADNPNSNTQFWTKDDLALGEYSIKYSPLNMLHKQTTPVGFFLSTRTINLADGASFDEEWSDGGIRKPKKGKHRFIHPSQVHNVVYLYPGSTCVACGQPASDPAHDGTGTNPPVGGGTGTGGTAAPAAGGDTAAAQGTAKIEALSAMWSHVFPFEAALVDQADDMGSLFYSMECRGTHLHCAGPNGCDQTFDYMAAEDHCQHLKERSSVRHIVNPTFRGGALIIPPTRPGWTGAEARVYQDASIRDEANRYAELTEAAYNQVNADGADLSVSAWESLMAQVVSLTHS